MADTEAFQAALDGVFSLFVWDRRSRTLQLSSDRMGHKLVYYFEDRSRHLLVFSTELKAVLAHPAVPRQLDEGILPLYLRFGFVPGPLTLAKGVRKLRPAECLSFAVAETSSKRFWRPELETEVGDSNYWVERTRGQIVSAVGRSIGAAEKVGVNLSGGIDSSVILAATKQGGFGDIQAFTLAYKGQAANEDVAWALRVAQICGVPHQTVVVDAETELTPELMSSLMRQSDEPFISAGRFVSQYFLGRAQQAAGIDSTLNGTFTSPLFNLRRVRKLAEAGQTFESLDRALRAGLERSSYFHDNRLNLALATPVDEAAQLREASLVNREVVDGLDPIQGMTLAILLRWSASRFSLYFQLIPPLLGLEERAPFLDSELVLFTLAVPPTIRGVEAQRLDKTLLHVCFRDQLQLNFRQRRHAAFPNPPWPGWLAQMIVPSLKPLAEAGIVRPEYLRWLQRNLKQGRKRAQTEAWLWFVLSCWYQFQIKQSDPFAGTG